MATKSKSLAELYEEYESLKTQGKAMYEQADAILAELVDTWKKNKDARVDEEHVLEIEDNFRGQVKAFAPGFAHRYKLKLKALART
jgi:hypothetical protein